MLERVVRLFERVTSTLGGESTRQVNACLAQNAPLRREVRGNEEKDERSQATDRLLMLGIFLGGGGQVGCALGSALADWVMVLCVRLTSLSCRRA